MDSLLFGALCSGDRLVTGSMRVALPRSHGTALAALLSLLWMQGCDGENLSTEELCEREHARCLEDCAAEGSDSYVDSCSRDNAGNEVGCQAYCECSQEICTDCEPHGC